MKIFTHWSVDLDTVCSVWAARQFIPGAKDAEIEFFPANWSGETMNESDIAIDMNAGGRGLKGRKGENGIFHSCFNLILNKYARIQDLAALAILVCFVNEQKNHRDAFGGVDRRKSCTLEMIGPNAVLRALQVTHAFNDRLVVERMSEILSGMLQRNLAIQTPPKS